ncbi:hypothetical protein [Streptomyces sp. NPDC059224]|uniref:hypothetical protein n=1 Tax=Streptomyces sp. NPDC059224 TaxID=3346775 RepID=UPI003692C8E3
MQRRRTRRRRPRPAGPCRPPSTSAPDIRHHRSRLHPFPVRTHRPARHRRRTARPHRHPPRRTRRGPPHRPGEQALSASEVIPYAQGLHQIQAADDTYKRNIDLAAVAALWRAGCIIRAAFLDRVRDAYATDPAPPGLLTDPGFAQGVGDAQLPWRPGHGPRRPRRRPCPPSRPRSPTTTPCTPRACRPPSPRQSATASRRPHLPPHRHLPYPLGHRALRRTQAPTLLRRPHPVSHTSDQRFGLQ